MKKMIIKAGLNFLGLSLTVLFFSGCKSNAPYLKHKVEISKVSDNCTELSSRFGMTANIMGERYEFQQCMDADFTGEKMQVKRQGDTVLVQFPGSSQNKDLFNVKLDIDTWPKYKFITIGDQTFQVVVANK
jgi:hypothetical protein